MNWQGSVQQVNYNWFWILINLLEYGANFGHEYYLAYVHSTLFQYLSVCYVVSPDFPCDT